MNERGKSDKPRVPEKPANKEGISMALGGAGGGKGLGQGQSGPAKQVPGSVPDGNEQGEP